ncbi:MAG: hypothetical protein ACP5JJ_14210 [Anaerolineae bacterium]
MEDLLGALMGGGQQPSKPEDEISEEDPLAQLLQGLMAGQASPGEATQAAQDAPLENLDTGSLLQGILGGSGGLAGGAGHASEGHAAQPAADPVPGGPDLGGLLQGLLGGTGGSPAGTGQAAAQSAGGLGDILGAIMGGGSPALASNPLLAPIVTGLAEKLGLPPQIAQTVVAFVLGKLVESRMQPGLDATSAPTRSGSGQPQATTLEDVVVQRMNSGKRVTKAEVRRTGLARELAAHTGLKRTEAVDSLQEVLNALGGNLGAAQ